MANSKGRLPDNLYKNGSYYKFRNPLSGKSVSLGSDRASAIKSARLLNDRLDDITKKTSPQRRRKALPLVREVVAEFLEDHIDEFGWATETRKSNVWRLKRVERSFGSRAIESITRLEIGDWLSDTTPSNEAYNKSRKIFSLLITYAISRGYCEVNEAEMTLARSNSRRLEKNRRKRERMTMEQFRVIKNHAPQWLKNAMDLSLVTLQSRKEICNMRFSDVENDQLYVIRAKVAGKSDLAFIAIEIEHNLRRIISACRMTTPVSAFFVSATPRKMTAQVRQKSDLTQVNPDFLTKQFKKAREATGLFDGMDAGQCPSFHEIRSLGSRLYEKQGFDRSYIQRLMTHSDVKTTEIYLENGSVDRDRYYKAKASLNINEAMISLV